MGPPHFLILGWRNNQGVEGPVDAGHLGGKSKKEDSRWWGDREEP